MKRFASTLALIGALLVAGLFGAAAHAAPGASVSNRNVPTGSGDALFVVYEGGVMEPIAVRENGKFIEPGPIDGAPSDKLRMEANASIAAAGNRVHVVFGGRTIATVAAKVVNGGPVIPVPASLHLSQNVNALASPTLSGNATSPRRAPTAQERAAVLAAAAAKLGASAANLDVRNLTALNLGRGTALVGTVSARGKGTPRVDNRAFFISEPVNGKPTFTLFNAQKLTVSEPLLEEVNEHLADAIDLGDGALSVVTTQVGYDAHTFAIYSRSGAGWKKIYTGGGVAL